MANKTYFKGNNKKRKNTKKYQFAGFDESMQIDNTGYLNALYNPNYYDAPTVSNEDIKQNVTADVATSQKLAMDAKVAKTGTETSLERLQRLKKEAEEKAKQQFSEANQQSKDQAIISSGTDLLTKGSDIAKQFMKPLAPATNAATTGSFSLPSNIGTFSTSGVQPGLQLGKQGISLGKGTFTSQMGTVGAKTGAEVGKQGFMSSLGSSTWATPGASATASGIGAGLSIGGKLWDTLSEDDNPYEYTKAEKWGDWGGNLLSDIGTYGGLGASFGPIGAGIGAVVGAGIGTVKAIRESKKNKKQAADLNAKKAEEDRLYQEQIANYNNALASQQRFYDYTKRQLRSNVLTGEEQMRQNRLMQLTEGQLAGNTNIAMTGGGRKYFGKGGAKVPGGKVVPIGQGAVEFVGRKHSQGGIMLDSQTEVEGGETMDKVMMTGGEFSDYFFSDHLKNGGKSFAQHHKELIKRGASQKEIQALAKKQEAMANKRGEKDRSPSQVAEYGGVKKYFTGGVRKYKTAGAVEDPPNKNISIEDFKKLGKYDRWELVYNIAKNLGDKFPELVASQFALESAWGTKPTGTWNFFGQTGRSNQNTKTLGTPRDPGGGSKKFINFNSLEEGIKYRVDKWSPMYKDAETVDEAMSIILKLPGKTKSGKNFADLNTRGIYASGYPTREHPEGDRGKVKDSLNNIIADAKKETNYATSASPSPVSSKTEIPGLNFSRPPLPSGAVQSVPFFEEAFLGLGRGAINLGRAGLNFLRKGTSQYFGESSSTPSTSTGLQTTRPNPQNIPLDYSVGNFTGNVARNPPLSYWEQIVENSAILKPNPTEALLRTANATRPLVNKKASEEAAKGDKETTGTPENVKTGDASYNYDFNIDYSPLNLPPLGANLPEPAKPAAKTAPEKLTLKGTDNLKLPQAPPKLPVMKPALAEPPVDKNNLNYYLPILASAGAQAAGTLATVSKLKNIPAPTFPNYNVPLMQPIPTAPGMPPIGSTPQVNLGRVALDKERTAIDNTFTASTDFIKNNLAGPEAIPILLASQQKSNESLLKVADEEQRLNRDIREKETLVNVDISEKNRRAAMDAYKQYTEGLLTTQQFNTKIAEANQRAMQEKYNYELEKNKALNEFQVAKDMSIAGAWEKLGIGLGDTITSAANVYYENELAKDILKGTGVYNRNFQMGGPKKYFPSRLGDLKNRKLKVKA